MPTHCGTSSPDAASTPNLRQRSAIEAILTKFVTPIVIPLRLERVNRWERIASHRRPAFSSHLISSINGEVKKSTSLTAGKILTFQPA
jgi:hypothetical protein